MKMKDLNKKSEKELHGLLLEKQSGLSAFRFGIAGSNVRNVKEGRMLKKDIARINTLLTASAKAAAKTAK